VVVVEDVEDVEVVALLAVLATLEVVAAVVACLPPGDRKLLINRYTATTIRIRKTTTINGLELLEFLELLAARC
jgi:hypothetical protein